MNDQGDRVYRILGTVFFWVGIGILALFGMISFWAGPIMLFMSMVTGLPFLLIGLGFLTWLKKKERMVNEVIEMGHTVEAVITDIRPDLSITINGRHPWLVEAAYDDPETLSVQIFTTHTDDWRPSERMIGGKVTVFVDPLDTHRYAVDLDTVELPEEEEEDLSDLLTSHSSNLLENKQSR